MADDKGLDLDGINDGSLKKNILDLQSSIDTLNNTKIDIGEGSIKAAAKAIREATDSIEKYKKELDSTTISDDRREELEKVIAIQTLQLKQSKKLISDAGSLTNKLGNQLMDAKDSIAAVAMSTKLQYEIGEGIAEQYFRVNKELGVTGNRAMVVRDNFKDALPDIQALGGTASELAETYKEFSESSGRQNVLGSEDLKSMMEFRKATGMAATQVAGLYERFTLMGVSIDRSHKLLNELTNSSNKLGINSTKVLKVLSNNMDSMQRMSFRGGVKGMTEMAQLAVRMRMDVSDMLGMAEKFYEPEAAIEAAAQLQLMGGDIAQAFGDPFETMYLARNKPEELAKKLQTMTENMIDFNEVTGQYEIPAEARQQLEFTAKQLGVNSDKMIDLAFQSSKIKDVKMGINAEITDEGMRETLAAMAQKKDGKWTVDVGGEEIPIGELTKDQSEKLKAFSDENILKTQAKATMTNTETLEANTTALRTTAAIAVAQYELTGEQVKKAVQTFGQMGIDAGNLQRDATQPMVTAAEKVIGSGVRYGTDAAESGFGSLLDGISNFIGNTAGGSNASDTIEGSLNSISSVIDENNTINKISTNTENLQTAFEATNNNNINVDGNIGFDDIKITLDGSSSQVSLNDEDKKSILAMIQEQMKNGINASVTGSNTGKEFQSTLLGG